MNKSKSVLVFDSGVGGLSVFQEISALLPSQHIIYAFDNAAFPYGELEDERLIYRVKTMISKVCQQADVSLVVIACNTASTLVLPILRDMLSIPVVGVVPAIKPAAALSQTKKIGLLATPATIKRAYTNQLIAEFSEDCHVELVGSTQLVLMAEEKLSGKTPDIAQVTRILQPLIGDVDCVVLGCTHFPLLKKEIAGVLGKDCQVIDSGKAVAQRVQYLLKKDNALFQHELNVSHQLISSRDISHQPALIAHFSSLGFDSITHYPPF